MKAFPLRLDHGTDLKQALLEWARRERPTAAWVMTCVGSLGRISLRLAEVHTSEGEYEITSLAGTLSRTGVHLHLTVADPAGVLIGGHVMGGCVVADGGTVELVLGADGGWRFERGPDPVTGFDELTISPA
jgi:predicted DNA-binding protein with PD1-like motif